MTFSTFKKSISKISKVKLSGSKSHQEMLPPERISKMKPKKEVQKNTRKAGVMALFYPNKQGETMLVLILRKSYKGVHSAQIGFPGGKVEPEDFNLQATALRETQEEIGVNAEKIQVLRALTRIYIPPSNFWVYPFIGITDHSPTFTPQESEVETIIEVKLDDFLNDNFITDAILSTSYATNIKVPAFQLNGHIVWGATGMMLNEVKAMLKMIL